MPLLRIEDPEDPRVALYRNVRERDLAGRHGVFLAEGEVVVRILLSERSRFRAASLLLSQTRAAALAAWLEGLDTDLEVLVAPCAVLDAIAGFPLHRGVLAAGIRSAPATASELLPAGDSPALALGLIGLANHDNVGGIFRNAAAFGAAAVLLDERCCDPLYRKAIRVSAGNVLTTPFARCGSAEDVVQALTEGGFEVVGLSPGASALLDSFRWPPRTALLVGAEGAGLSPALLSRSRTLRIGMAPGVDSLNVAAATAIALHAARTHLRTHRA